jgi:hypothetical protein
MGRALPRAARQAEDTDVDGEGIRQEIKSLERRIQDVSLGIDRLTEEPPEVVSELSASLSGMLREAFSEAEAMQGARRSLLAKEAECEMRFPGRGHHEVVLERRMFREGLEAVPRVVLVDPRTGDEKPTRFETEVETLGWLELENERGDEGGPYIVLTPVEARLLRGSP